MPETQSPRPLRSRINAHAREWREFLFTIDLRSLGAYRIALACLLIYDWCLRWPHLEAFYTSFGVLPIEAPLPRAGGSFHLPLLDWFTSLPSVRIVFLLGLGAYVLLGLGWRTSVAKFVSFIFFMAVLNRNILTRDGADVFVLSLFIWILFLPVGERFSLDSHRKRRRLVDTGPPDHRLPGAARSVAAFAIVLQIGLLYFYTALAKYGQTWIDGTALYYTLHHDQFAKPIALWLRQQPLDLLKVLSHSAIAIELLALPMIVCGVGQPRLRRAAVLGLVSLHLGIAVLLRIEVFSVTMIASYLLLMTPADWDDLVRAGTRIRAAIAPLHVRPPERSPVESAAPSHHRGWMERPSRVVSNVAAALLLVVIAIDGYNRNVAARPEGFPPVPLPGPSAAFISATQLRQRWHLFAPDPPKDDGYWLFEGTREDGQVIYSLTGPNPRLWVNSVDRLWRKYLNRVRTDQYREYQPYLAGYLFRLDHRAAPPGQRLTRLDFYYVQEFTQPPGTPQPFPERRLLIWSHGPRAVVARP